MKLFLIVLIAAFILSCGSQKQTQPEKFLWETTRGVNIGIDATEQDIADLSEWGANHVRMSFPVEPFMELEEPYNFVESSFEKLDLMLDICEKYNIKVVIDPHRYPGTAHKWTMLSNDEFWNDYNWHDKVLAIWERIAKQCVDRGNVIAGYAITNEPAVPYNNRDNTPSDLNLLYKKAIELIRKYDTKHTIIISSPRMGVQGQDDKDYIYGLDYLQVQNDDNLVYEIHMYKPKSFTHQGVWEESEFIEYPGEIDGDYWDINKVRRHLKPAKDFADKHGIKVYVGEFSCPRWTGDSGIKWLADVIQVYEEYGFSWAYHAYREHTLWDAEADNYDPDKTERVKTTPRKELLINSFELNNN